MLFTPAALAQEVGCLGVLGLECPPQGSQPRPVFGVEAGVVRQQHVNHRQVPAGGRPMQRGSAILILGVNLRPLI